MTTMLGGLLWGPYGVFEMLEPWGAATVYRDDLGYEAITDPALFVTYSLPGSLALLLTSLGLIGLLAQLRLPQGRAGRITCILAYVAMALAILSLLGVIVLFDPLFTAGRIFGTLALGSATILAGLDARRHANTRSWFLALFVLGVTGVFLLPLWPLVYAVQWLPQSAGAGIIAGFGLGWLMAGYRMDAVHR